MVQRMLNFGSSYQGYAYSIEHLEGSPHGPCFSSICVSGCSLALDFVVEVFFAPSSCSFPLTAAVPSPSVVLGPSSHAKLTLEIMVPKLSPWIVATSSSKAVG